MTHPRYTAESRFGRRIALAFTALLCLAGLAGTPATSAAQEAPAAPAAPAAAPKKIPADEIPARANTHMLRLSAIRERIPSVEPDDETGRLAEVVRSIEAFVSRREVIDLDRLPEMRIVQLQREAGFYAVELKAVEAEIAGRATRLSASAAEVAGMREVWEATLAASATEGLARPLILEGRRVLEQIAATERALDQPLAAALKRRDRLASYAARVETVQRAIDQALARAAGRLLRLDVPPIWRLPEIAPRKIYEATRANFVEQLSFLEHYLKASRSGIEIFILLAVTLLAVILWLKRRPGWTAGAISDLPDAGQLLKRPYSALALLVLLTTLTVIPSPPVLLDELLVMLLLIPLIRLAPRRMVAGYPSTMIVLAALVFVDRPRTLLPFDSLSFRANLLLVSTGALLSALWLLRLRRRAGFPPLSWIGLVSRVAPLLAGLMLIALAANLLGNLSLADYLTRSVIATAFVSASLYAAAIIVHDLLALFVRTRLGRSMRMVTEHGDTLVTWIQRTIRLVAILTWVWGTLQIFGIWQPVMARVTELLGHTWKVGELELSLGGILGFAVGVLLAVFASRAVRFLLKEEVLTRVAWPAGAKSTTATLAYYSVLAGGLLLAFTAAGVEMTQFAIIVGALGVGIGFGLQTVVNNFVSGLILMFERPIQPGDIIDVETLQGRVLEIGLRATRIKTWEGAEVVVPNGTLLSGNLVNWTLSDSARRVDVNVGVAYGTNVRRVLEILTEVAQRQSLAMKEPEPIAVFNGFGDSSLDFTVRFWIRDANTVLVARSGAYVDVCEALAEAGIEIPFPQRDLHLRSVDAGAAGMLRGRPGDAAADS